MSGISTVLSNLPAYIANVRKALINITGLAAALLTLGLLPDNYAAIVSTVIAVVTVIVHYLTPNAVLPPSVTKTTPPVVASPVLGTPDAVTPASQVASDNEIASPPAV